MTFTTNIWRVQGATSRPITLTPMDLEERLEDLIVNDPDLLGPDQLLIIDRQVLTSHGKKIDLLAVDDEQILHAIELKKDRTEREVVSQALDYGWWIRSLAINDVRALWAERKIIEADDDRDFDEAYNERFKTDIDAERFNTEHRLTIVAAALDPATPRIIEYLADDYAVPINAVMFNHFTDGDREYLTRTWMRPPSEDDTKTAPKRAHRGQKQPWNGRDIFMPLGRAEDDPAYARWHHGIKYGFVGAGGGAAYWKFLRNLEPGMRVFAFVGSAGYIGIGEVTGPMVPLEDLTVTDHAGNQVRFVETDGCPPSYLERIRAGDPDQSEYAVPVEWAATVDLAGAIWEPGLHALPTPGRLRDTKTIEHVEAELGLSVNGTGFSDMAPAERLEHASEAVRSLFDQIETRCSDAGLKREDLKWWVNFTDKDGEGMSLVVRKTKLLIYTDRDADALDEAGFKVRDVSSIGHHGSGDTEVTVTSRSDLAVVDQLLEESLEA